MKKLLILFIPLMILISCNDDPPTSKPVFDPEMKADISGNISVEFEAQTFVSAANKDGRYVVMLGSPMVTDSVNYNMTLYFYFRNFETTGIFPITGFEGIDTLDYAVASFSSTRNGTNEFIYLSTVGTATITSIIGTRITGTFEFQAKDTAGNVINAENGILDIFN